MKHSFLWAFILFSPYVSWADESPVDPLISEFKRLSEQKQKASYSTCFNKVTKKKCSENSNLYYWANKVCEPSWIKNCKAATMKVQEMNKEKAQKVVNRSNSSKFKERDAEENKKNKAEKTEKLANILLHTDPFNETRAKELIETGADINDLYLKDPLIFSALSQNNSKVVEFVLKQKNLKVDVLGKAQKYPLTILIEKMLPRISKPKGENLILNIIDRGFDLNTQDPSGKTALHYVAMKCMNTPFPADVLIYNKASITIKDNDNKSPADYAIGCDNFNPAFPENVRKKHDERIAAEGKIREEAENRKREERKAREEEKRKILEQEKRQESEPLEKQRKTLLAQVENYKRILARPSLKKEMETKIQESLKLTKEQLSEIDQKLISIQQKEIDPELDEADLIDEMTCPITREIMTDPVRAKLDNGKYTHAYERDAITAWLATHKSDPLTRKAVTINQFKSDVELLKKIKKYNRENR
jgi:hypothetical protein